MGGQAAEDAPALPAGGGAAPGGAPGDGGTPPAVRAGGRRRIDRRLLLDAGLALLLLAVILGVATVYVSRERTFYAYDVGGYYDTAGGIAARCLKSPRAAWRMITGSLRSEYNALYTIPLLPALLLFGESRQVYIAALAVVYLLPFTLALGALGARLLPGGRRRGFWLTVAFTALTPAAWVPTLRGYPDTGAALLVALAALAAARDTSLRRWWQAPAIGVLLALAVIVRRHFAYAACAFLAALALLALLRWLLRAWRATPGRRALVAAVVPTGAAGLTSLVTILVVHPSFLTRLLTTDYYALHASYLHPPAAMVGWAAASYGVPAWAAIAAGFTWLIRRHARRGAAFVVGASGGLAVLTWVLVVRQVDPHYTLHFTPLVVLGLAACALLLREGTTGRLRALAPGLLGGWAGTNLALGLGFLPAADLPAALRPLFAAPAPPLTRPDREVVAGLVTYLRSAAPRRAPIYVAASSTTISGDLLTRAEQALYGREAARLNVLSVPEVDSRDAYPLAPLLQARYVVVVTPFQHHLPPEEQDVVRVVIDLFGAESEFAQDFTPLGPRFRFADGAVAMVYARQRVTSLPVAARTLRRMQAAIGARPGGQSPWLVFDRGIPAAVERDEGGQEAVTARPGPCDGAPATTFVWLGPGSRNRAAATLSTAPDPPARPLNVRGRIAFRDPGCQGVTFRFSRIDRAGELTPLGETVHRPGQPEEFLVTLPRRPSGGFLFEIVRLAGDDSAAPCTLTVTGLAVERADGR